MTNENHKTNACEVVALSELKSNLGKKSWFWIGFVITLSLLFIFNGVHLTITAFIFAPLVGISVGYCLWNIRRLILCTHFLETWIRNKPAASLSKLPISLAFEITRRCLHQFSLSVSFIIFATIAYLADPGYLFGQFYHLLLLSIICAIIYGFCLLFAHAHVAAKVGHPIIHCLKAYKPVNDEDPIEIPAPSAGDHVPDLEKEIEKVNKRSWDIWMHDPANPASAEHHLTSPWNKRYGDDY